MAARIRDCSKINSQLKKGRICKILLEFESDLRFDFIAKRKKKKIIQRFLKFLDFVLIKFSY